MDESVDDQRPRSAQRRSGSRPLPDCLVVRRLRIGDARRALCERASEAINLSYFNVLYGDAVGAVGVCDELIVSVLRRAAWASNDRAVM